MGSLPGTGLSVRGSQLRATPSDPRGLQVLRRLCPWDSPGKNTGGGCHFLLQGIFLTQEVNPCILHWQTGCYCCFFKPSEPQESVMVTFFQKHFLILCLSHFINSHNISSFSIVIIFIWMIFSQGTLMLLL